MKLNLNPKFPCRVFLICMSVVFCSLPIFSQQSPGAFFHIYYNHHPDTLYLDGKPVNLLPKTKYPISPGVHTFKAIANCYHPIEKRIEVKPGKIKFVKFKFKHLSSKERVSYTWLKRMNLFTGVIATGGSFVSSSGLKYALPINLLGIGENLIWNQRVKKLFHPCTYAYEGRDMKQPFFQISAGVSSVAKSDFQISSDDVLKQTFQVPGVNYTLRWNTNLKVTFNPNSDYLSNYAINLGGKIDLIKFLSASVTTQIFPFSTTEAQLEDSLLFYQKTDSRRVSENKPLFLTNYNLHLVLYRRLDQAFSIVVGGYQSNTIKGNLELPLVMPDIDVLKDSTAVTRVDYEFQASGFQLGLQYQYYFKDRLSFYIDYHYHFSNTFRVNESEKKSSFFRMSAGLSFGV